jgi:ATP-dependent 26S proteasome regulatory subunit
MHTHHPQEFHCRRTHHHHHHHHHHRHHQVLMCTNRIDILDPALLRPGRIDRKIEFPNPGEGARLEILKIHSRKMNLTRGINLRKIADTMPGASGAEIKVTIPLIVLLFIYLFI